MIVFRKIRYKNLLSAGASFTEWELDGNQTTLIVGDNGSGKSILLDALSFVLFGKPFRNINKNQLINSINKKQTVVEVEFDIGKNHYKIVRGIKPNVFDIYKNGDVVNKESNVREDQQYLELSILKMSYKAFRQIVVLGSADYVPFMQLTPAARREVIEDILDIGTFSKMSAMVKDDLSLAKSDYQLVENDYDNVKSAVLKSKETVDSLKNLIKKSVGDVKDKIDKAENSLEKHLKKHDKLKKEQDKYTSNPMEDKRNLDNNQSEIDNLHSKIKICKSNIDKYKNEETVCSECGQKVDKSHFDDKIQELEKNIVSYESSIEEKEKINEELQKLYQKSYEYHQKWMEYDSVLDELDDTIRSIRNTISIFKDQIKENEKGDAKVLLDKAMKDGKEQVEKAKALKTKLKGIESEISVLIDVRDSLKDNGIKAQIIKTFLPVFNKHINKYLGELNFFAEFHLNENFDETIKSRYRDDFSYASFSQGEKMRIDLALMFTWREIARIRSSVSTNLLIMDEVFDSSLDEQGADDFINMIKSLTSDTNTFIISHRGDSLNDKFESMVVIKKRQNFSEKEMI